MQEAITDAVCEACKGKGTTSGEPTVGIATIVASRQSSADPTRHGLADAAAVFQCQAGAGVYPPSTSPFGLHALLRTAAKLGP
jgi:hypothetical protein